MTEPTYTVSFWLRKILVPVDGSENSFRALELAIDFAMRYGSQISIIHVCEECNEQSIKEKVEKRVKGRVDYEFKIIKFSGSESSVSNEILRYLSENSYDAIILGARGLSINSDINIGSVALSLSVNAPTTVILVR